MTTIALNRRFYEWRKDGLDHSSYRAAAGLSDGMLGWTELLARRRIVILAEAGSGKTEELTRLQSAAGKFAFYTTVQDVGRDGLAKGLRPADRPRLDAWRTSNEPGWLFIDSIDEAKLDNIRLKRALRQMAEGIAGGEGRAHIVLSGRHTDWEFARDARRLNEELPLPHENPAEPLPSLETLIRRVLRREAQPEPMPAEKSLRSGQPALRPVSARARWPRRHSSARASGPSAQGMGATRWHLSGLRGAGAAPSRSGRANPA